MTNTNGTTNGTETPATATAKPSPLIAIRAEYEKNGGKVDGKAAKALAAQFLKDQEAVKAVEAKLAEAKAALYATSRKLMVATGAAQVTIGGVAYNPSTIKGGDTVFYRPAGQRETIAL